MESVKPPLEFVSASFRRTQKALSSEVKDIIAKLEHAENSPQAAIGREDHVEKDKDKDKDKDSGEVHVLAGTTEKLTALLKLLDEADVAEKEQLKKIHARCQEFHVSSTPSPFKALSDRKELILIGDFLLRRGELDAVDSLIKESGEWLDQMLDVKIYRTAAAVESSVMEGRLDLALQWVQDHASKLRRLNSALEFFIRQEQFLALVYRGRSLEALRFAQTHLAPLVTDKPAIINNLNGKEDMTPSFSIDNKERRSSSITSECSDDVSLPPPTIESATTPNRFSSRALPQRQRAASLGTPPASSVRGGEARIFSPYRPSRTSSSHSSRVMGARATGAHFHSTPPRHSNSSPIVSSSMVALPVSLPFSFSANPLAFFRYSRGPSDSPTRGRERSSSGNFTDYISGDATFAPPDAVASSHRVEDYTSDVAAQEQSVYMKEAMCHLMSLLAFMSQTDEDGDKNDERDTSDVQVSKKSKASVDSSSPSLFGSMVPCLYERMYTPHRRRCIVDLFRVEFRRVYSLGHISALEQYIKLGVFALKTPACGAKSREVPSKEVGEKHRSSGSPGSCNGGSTGSSNGGGTGMIDALRYVRQSIRSARNRVRTSSAGSSSSSGHSGGGDDMEIEMENEINDTVTASSAGRTPPPPPHSSRREAIKSSNDSSVDTDCTNKLFHSDKQLPQRSGHGDLGPVCPVCTPEGQIISSTIPAFASRSESVLVCRGSGEVMNHDNPPVALPNGQVYSKAFVMSNAHPKDYNSIEQVRSIKGTPWEKLFAKGTGAKEEGDGVNPNDPSSSIFGGCYCGGSGSKLQTTGSTPHSPPSSCRQQEPEDMAPTEDNKVTGDVGNGGDVNRPLSAIEVMMGLRNRHEADFASVADRSGVITKSIESLLCSNSIRECDLESKRFDSNDSADQHLEQGMVSDSPPLPPPPLYFTCPVTGSTVDISLLRPVFIV